MLLLHDKLWMSPGCVVFLIKNSLLGPVPFHQCTECKKHKRNNMACSLAIFYRCWSPELLWRTLSQFENMLLLWKILFLHHKCFLFPDVASHSSWFRVFSFVVAFICLRRASCWNNVYAARLLYILCLFALHWRHKDVYTELLCRTNPSGVNILEVLWTFL